MRDSPERLGGRLLALSFKVTARAQMAAMLLPGGLSTRHLLLALTPLAWLAMGTASACGDDTKGDATGTAAFSAVAKDPVIQRYRSAVLQRITSAVQLARWEAAPHDVHCAFFLILREDGVVDDFHFVGCPIPQDVRADIKIKITLAGPYPHPSPEVRRQIHDKYPTACPDPLAIYSVNWKW